MPLNKMQIRVELISLLNKYVNCKFISQQQLNLDCQAIKDLNNEEQTAKILLKEIVSKEGVYQDVCIFFLLDSISDKVLKSQAEVFLKNKDLSAENKLLIVSILKEKDIKITFEEIDEYVKLDDEAKKESIKMFLSNIITNAQAQIDLLDFYINIPQNERFTLIDNLYSETQGDNLANALSLIALVTQEKEEVKILANCLKESKSPFAIYGLEKIIEQKILDEDENKELEKNIRKLKLKNPNFKDLSLIKNSKPERFLINYIDGCGEFLMFFSRISPKGIYDVFITTINIDKGITSAIGFSEIDCASLVKIIQRIFVNFKPIEINGNVFQSIYQFYKNKNTRKNILFPYEAYVWEKLLNDIKPLENDLSFYLNSALKKTSLSKKGVDILFKDKTFETWFYLYGQNKKIDNFLDEIENNKITDLKEIEKIQASLTEELLSDEEYVNSLKNRLLIQAYFLELAKYSQKSSITYSLCFEEELFKYLIYLMLNKTIYEYFCEIFREMQDEENHRIFKKKKNFLLSEREVDKILSQIEEEWKLEKE